jgi:hypothetical protein
MESLLVEVDSKTGTFLLVIVGLHDRMCKRGRKEIMLVKSRVQDIGHAVRLHRLLILIGISAGWFTSRTCYCWDSWKGVNRCTRRVMFPEQQEKDFSRYASGYGARLSIG